MKEGFFLCNKCLEKYLMCMKSVKEENENVNSNLNNKSNEMTGIEVE